MFVGSPFLPPPAAPRCQLHLTRAAMGPSGLHNTPRKARSEVGAVMRAGVGGRLSVQPGTWGAGQSQLTWKQTGESHLQRVVNEQILQPWVPIRMGSGPSHEGSKEARRCM